MSDKDARMERVLSPSEFLPGWVIYGPLVIFWILSGLRYRDFAVATLANPHIPSGGLCNESKSEILAQGGPDATRHVAPWRTFPTGPAAFETALKEMSAAGFSFPVVLKPDIGCKGAGVRLVSSREQLRDTLRQYADDTLVMLQAFIPYENEAGIFYSRQPTEQHGRILSMTFKSPPEVTGDGVRTLRDLVLAHPRAGKVPHIYLPRLTGRLDTIPKQGERVRLVFTGNHSKGSQFRDATSLVSRQLSERIDRIAQSYPDFHHGRIDLRFRSIDSLRAGQDFQIIEVNGIGSEPIHMWSPEKNLLDIYRIQFDFYGRAFRIGDLMKKRGHRGAGTMNMLWQWRRQTALIATYPQSE
ncbi:D-alanine--D-alanine ligase [Neoasaia chiangmaiensis NBRC 101099]|nr:D-alanine--D-alanine ligase [Neoasaia chiangmaiensis NBRC 101099]